MSTYVDLILNRVEFKIMACILLEKTVSHCCIGIYYYLMCERYGTLYRFNRDHIKCKSEVKTKNRTLNNFFTALVLKSSDKSIMLLPK